MKTYKRICRSCNQEVMLELPNQRYCAPCREAKAAAELAARTKVCNVCGVIKFTRHGVCEECAAAKDRERWAKAELREARRLRRFGPYPTHPSQSIQEERRELAARYARLNDEQKALAKAFGLLWFGYVPEWLMRAPDVADPAPANPEQVPADDQAAVDAAFLNIMTDIDI